MKGPICRLGVVPALLCVAMLPVLVPSQSAQSQTAKFVGAQSAPISGLAFPSPSDVTMDAAGNLYYLTDTSVVKATPTIGGYTKTTVVSGLFSPDQMAVDKAGNLYIAEQLTSAQATTGHLYKETLSHGIYTQSIIPTPITIPLSVAVDSAGSIYVGGNYDQIVKLTPVLTTYTQTFIGSGLNNPRYLALDAKGDVIVADTQNNRVVKETLANGAYTQSVIGTGLNFPEGAAVDGAGAVYVSDSGNFRVVKLTPSGLTYVKSVVPIISNWLTNNPYGAGPGGMVVDKYGSLLIADSLNGQIIKWSPLGADFGQIKTGTTSPVISLLFSFSAPGTLYNIATLTQGMVQSDFAYSTTGSCAPGTFYFGNTICTLDVKFTPSLAGDRDGAVLLHNSSLTTFATGYMHGVGMGAQMQYFSGSEKTVPFSSAGSNPPYGVAVDGYGTVYIADVLNNRVLKETLSGPNYVESTVGTGLLNPAGVAVDAGGNVYIADTGNDRVLKETPSWAGWSQTVVGSGMSGPNGVAVGPDGSVYVTDTQHSRILKETPSGSGYAQTLVLVPAVNIVHPYGIAVDGFGNLYVADPTNSQVVKLTLANGVYTPSVMSTLGGIYGLAADPLGNIYMALFNNGGVLKFTPSGSTYTNTFVPISGLASPYAVALDAWGDPYVADVGNRQVMKADFGAAPSLKFASTNVGSVSADSPKVVNVANYGNLPMNLSIPATGENPSISTNFSYVNEAGHPCPIVDSSAATGSPLAVGKNCVMYVTFKPTAAGNIGGTLTFTDDALNPTHPGTSHQNIALSGVGAQVKTQLTWPVPAAITYGTALSATQLNATATDGSNPIAGVLTYLPPSGTVLAAGTQPLGVKFAPTNTAEYTNASMTVNLQVQKAVLTVTAKAQSKHYGTANPTLTYAITGFVNGDTLTTAVTGVPTLTTPAVTGSPVGAYTITPAVGTLAATNYTFNFVTANLTVNKAGLTVTANALSKVYGAANPTLTYAFTGFVNGDTAATAVTGLPDLATTAVAGSPVGAYTITPTVGTLAATNYLFKFVTGTLTVNKAALTITANNASVAYNQAIPAFTYTPSGFVNGDTATTAVTGAPTETTTASLGSLPGTYPINIVAGTLAATNYSFTMKAGTLTITALGTVATPTFTPIAGTYVGARDVTITDSTAGAVIHYTTDGTTPTAASATYSTAIHVAATATIKAIAIKTGYTNSAVASALYTIN